MCKVLGRKKASLVSCGCLGGGRGQMRLFFGEKGGKSRLFGEEEGYLNRIHSRSLQERQNSYPLI